MADYDEVGCMGILTIVDSVVVGLTWHYHSGNVR